MRQVPEDAVRPHRPAIRGQASVLRLGWIGLALLGAVALGQQRGAAEPLRVEGLLDLGEPLWKLSGDGFQAGYGRCGFRWTSAEKATARAYKTPIQFLQRSVVEALARFEGGHLAGLTLVLYSRGDVGGLPFEAFRSMVSQLGADLNAWTETKQPAEVKLPLTARGVRMKAYAWVKGPHQFVAEWSHTELAGAASQPEFVRVRIEPFDPSKDPRSALATASAAIGAKRVGTVRQGELRRNVSREANGDVVVPNVPMVDQGPKGYCAVATTERILSYYGLEADQHVMAQLAQSSAEGGTSLQAMLDSLNAYGPKLGCRVREKFGLDYKALQSLSSRYDREARKQGKPPSLWTPPRIDLGKLFDSMDKAILLDLKAKDADAKRFVANVKESIDQGIPLTWGVLLGLVPETPAIPQASGGHLRIIIGYNPQTKELLYSDSWGRGHEVKRMSMDAAWAITMSLHAIEPRHLTL